MDLDAAIRTHEPVAMFIDRDKNKSYKERIRLLVALIEKNRRERILGPGRYELVKERKKSDVKFGIVYRRNSVEIRKVRREKRPGPQNYEVNDKLIRENTRNIVFNKEERYKRQKKITLEALDLHYSIDFLIKNSNKIVNSKTKRVKGIYFGKEKESKTVLTEAVIINERADLKRGPQSYEPNFNLTEKRTDLGIIKQKKYGTVEESNYRENVMEKYMVNEDVGDPGGEVPVTTLTKLSHNAAYAYHQPTDHLPQHIPEAELFPEHWEFYEKDNGQLSELAGKLFKNKEEFKTHEGEMNALKWLLNKWRKQPEVGKYEPKEIEAHLAQIDFGKNKGRDVIEEEPEEELLLSPEKPSKHIMVRRFSQMLGREEPLEKEDQNILIQNYQEEEEEEKVKVEKKVPCYVDMARQLGRKEEVEQEEEVVIIEPKDEFIQQKPKGIDFDRMKGREDYQLKQEEIKEEPAIMVDVGPAIDKIKYKKAANVYMEKGGERFPEEKIEIPSGITTEERINVDQAINAVKPRAVGQQGFGKLSVRDFRITKKKKKEEEEKTVSVNEEGEGEEAFEKYQEDQKLEKFKVKESNNEEKSAKIVKKNPKKQGKSSTQKQAKLTNSVGPWNNPSNINNF